MSPVEVVAFGTLWFAFIGVAALVLLLYRQVEHAYSSASGADIGGLPSGVDAPDIEVLREGSEAPLGFGGPGMLLLAFVSSSCESCQQLLTTLKDQAPFGGRIVGLVNGETTRELRELSGELELEWLAHPPDVMRSYGVSVVPMVYIIYGRTVLASGTVATASGVADLVLEAEQRLASWKDGDVDASEAASRILH